jgi:hypothetical protein
MNLTKRQQYSDCWKSMKKGKLTGNVYLINNLIFLSVRIGEQGEDGRYLMYWTDRGGNVKHYTSDPGHRWSERSIEKEQWRLDETSVVRKLLDEYESK